MPAPKLWWKDGGPLWRGGGPLDCPECPPCGGGPGDPGGGGDPPVVDCGGCAGGIESVPSRWLVDTTNTQWSTRLQCCEDLYTGVFEVEFFGGDSTFCTWRMTRPAFSVSNPARCSSAATIPDMIVVLTMTSNGTITVSMSVLSTGTAGAQWILGGPGGLVGGRDCGQSYTLNYNGSPTPCTAGPANGSEDPDPGTATVTPLF